MSHPAAELSVFPVVVSFPVHWGEQDMFRPCQQHGLLPLVRIGADRVSRSAGLSDLMERERVGPILAAIGCNYRRQLTFPDTVEVGSRITRIGRSSLTMAHAIRSREQNAIVADGESTIVVFDYRSQKPTPVPEDIRAAINKLEGRTL